MKIKKETDGPLGKWSFAVYTDRAVRSLGAPWFIVITDYGYLDVRLGKISFTYN